MVVKPVFPAKTVAEFIAYAKANPGKINFGSAGTGSVAHVTGELFKMMAGIDMQHVPYRGAPLALADLLSGQVQVMFDNLPSSIDHIRAGRLRALGVSTPSRWSCCPACRRSPSSCRASRPAPSPASRAGRHAARVIDRLNKAVGGAGRSEAQGEHPRSRRRADADDARRVRRFLAEETEKWGKVIRAANIKPGRAAAASA